MGEKAILSIQSKEVKKAADKRSNENINLKDAQHTSIINIFKRNIMRAIIVKHWLYEHRFDPTHATM
jgi:hypothetical protein